MIKTLTDLFKYIQNPILEKDSNTTFLHRLSVFVILLIFSIFASFFISIIIGMLEFSGLIYKTQHVFDDMFKNISGLKILFFASIMAPLIEETIFRAPLVLFKKPRIFKIAFYSIAIIFGYIHLFNYEINTNVLLFSPILVAPQIFIGLVFGFIRVRLGFLWSVTLHSVYNGILVSIFLLASHALKQ